MKEGWEYKKLGEVATFTRGLTYSKNDEAEISDNIVLRSNNVDLSTGKLNFDELKYLKPEFLIPVEKKVKKGSLLMCMSNGSKIHLGKVALINDDYPYAFGGFMALVTPNEELNPQFFNYSLSSPEYKDFIKKLSEGANINNIKVKELELFTIPVPPLSEQQSIVDYLDSAFAKIDAMKANAEKALNEAKALFQASLKEMLEPKEGWEEKTLEEIAQIKIGPFGSLLHKRDYISGGVPLVNPIHMVNGHIAIDNNYTISESKANELSSYRLKENDIVFARRGEIGRCALVGRNEDTYLCGTGSLFVRFNQDVDYGFMLLLFQSKYCKEYLEKQATGATMLNINSAIVGNMTIKYPHIDIQQTIVTTLDSLKSKVDRLQENYDKISQECDALKQAILRQVFE